jgi:ribose/xylose/arabinose/galactoside ABC-type transport system permease subunit
MKNFSPTTGHSFELDVIAAVVVGGTSILEAEAR